MTPQDTNSGRAIAELNNIPTYKEFVFQISIHLDGYESEGKRATGNGTHLNGWSNRTNKLSEGNTKEFREDDREQLKSGPVESSGPTSITNRVNHQNPVHDGADDRVRYLR